MFNSNDVDGLAAYPAPRPAMWVTPPHLVHQTAAAIKKIAPEIFDVYLYAASSKTMPSGCTAINDLTRDHSLFNQKNERNSQAIIVVGYQALATKHGRMPLAGI